MGQTVVVIGVVVLAAAYVGRMLWRSLTKPETAACGCACTGQGAGCPANGGPQPIATTGPEAGQGCRPPKK